MYIRSCFVVIGLALATLSSPVRPDPTTVKNDVQNINQQTISLGNSINAFPSTGGTFLEVIAIANNATTLDDVVKSSTNDTIASAAFTSTQSSTIVTLLESLTTNTNRTLTNLINKKPALAGLVVSGVPALVLELLEELKGDTDALFAALLDKLTNDYVGPAGEQKTASDSSFNTAISAYESS